MSSTSLSEMPLPDAAGAFTLSLTQAATVLDVTPGELLALVRGGCVHALMLPPHAVTDRPPLRFAPGLLSLEREQTLTPHTRQRGSQVAVISRALGEYLSREPTAIHREAMEQDRPLLARTRSTGFQAHIRVEVLHQLCGHEPDGAHEMIAPMVLRSMVLDTLERWGCREMKGLRALDSGRQHWDKWWRVPTGIWSPGDRVPTLVDAPVFNPPEVSS